MRKFTPTGALEYARGSMSCARAPQTAAASANNSRNFSTLLLRLRFGRFHRRAAFGADLRERGTLAEHLEIRRQRLILKVIENGVFGRVIYDQPVQIQDGFRTVAELNNYSNLNIIAKLPFVQSSWYIDNLQTNQPPYGNNNPSCPKPPKQNHGHWNNGYGNGNNGYGNNNYPNNYPNYPGSYPNNYPNNYPTGSGGNYGYGNSNLMDDASLQTLIQTMKNAAFEDKMIGIAKTALKTSQLKTNQVHQLLGLFSFEQNKLELAKFCYDKTIDKNNYYTLYNDFTFSNYSTQLDKYINSK